VIAAVDPTLTAFIAFTFVLVVTPGSTTAVVIRNTLEGGRRSGLAAALGAAAGNTTHATLAGIGLSVLISRWPAAALAVNVGGAAYLAWLGVGSLRRAWREPDGGIAFAAETGGAPAPSAIRSFRDGAVVNLLNPPIITYYIAVVPSFIPSGAPRTYFAMLAAIHVSMALACHWLWALAFDRLRAWLRRPAARRLVEAATGVALIALAVKVMMS
jgi:threonine/homoserine/homoserine lactone efflux protein